MPTKIIPLIKRKVDRVPFRSTTTENMKGEYVMSTIVMGQTFTGTGRTMAIAAEQLRNVIESETTEGFLKATR